PQRAPDDAEEDQRGGVVDEEVAGSEGGRRRAAECGIEGEGKIERRTAADCLTGGRRWGEGAQRRHVPDRRVVDDRRKIVHEERGLEAVRPRGAEREREEGADERGGQRGERVWTSGHGGRLRRQVKLMSLV